MAQDSSSNSNSNSKSPLPMRLDDTIDLVLNGVVNKAEAKVTIHGVQYDAKVYLLHDTVGTVRVDLKFASI
jgi:hypothetical protein